MTVLRRNSITGVGHEAHLSNFIIGMKTPRLNQVLLQKHQFLVRQNLLGVSGSLVKITDDLTDCMGNQGITE